MISKDGVESFTPFFYVNISTARRNLGYDSSSDHTCIGLRWDYNVVTITQVDSNTASGNLIVAI